MGDLHRVDDALLNQVAVLERRGVEALAVRHVGDLGHHNGTVEARVIGDPERRLRQRAGHGQHAGLLLAVEAVSELLELLGNLHQRRAAAGDDALFRRRAGGVDGVFDAQLALVLLGLGGGADAQHGHTAGQLGQALLRLLLVPGRVGGFDLAADLVAAVLHSLGGASAVDDDGVVLGHRHAAGGAEVLQGGVLEVDADLRVDHGRGGDHREVVHKRLAALAEVRRLHGDDLKHLADGVDHQRLQRLTLDVLCHHEQRHGLGGRLLQKRQEVRQGGNLAAHQQHAGVLEHGLAGIRIRHEVRGEESLVKGDALGEVHVGVDGLGLLDGEHTVPAHLVHGAGDHLADLRVARGHGGHVRDLSRGLHLGRAGLELLDDLLGSGLDALVQPDRVRASRDVAQALGDERLGQKRCGGGAVAGDVVRLHGDGLHQLRTEVFKRVLEVDVAGDGHAVVGDGRATPGLGQHDVAAAGAERDLHRVGERVHAALDALAGLLIKCDEFCHGAYFSTTASRSRADSSRNSSPPYFSSVPPYLEKMTVSPSLTSTATRLPLSSRRPGPTAMTTASCGFSAAESGITRPDAVVVSASAIWTRTLSSSGLMLTFAMISNLSLVNDSTVQV